MSTAMSLWVELVGRDVAPVPRSQWQWPTVGGKGTLLTSSDFPLCQLQVALWLLVLCSLCSGIDTLYTFLSRFSFSLKCDVMKHFSFFLLSATYLIHLYDTNGNILLMLPLLCFVVNLILLASFSILTCTQSCVLSGLCLCTKLFSLLTMFSHLSFD